MAPATAEKPVVLPAAQMEPGVVSLETPGTDPLDIPYTESGIEQPVYHCAHVRDGAFYVHAQDQNGRSQLIYKGTILGGVYHYRTPREEAYVREDISQRLGGNSPDRWRGNSLDDEDAVRCECGLTFHNIKVANDHRRKTGHTPRLAP